MEIIVNAIKKFKTELLYLFFGICTVIVNTVCYYVLFQQIHIPNVPSTILAWVAAVIFAFATNRTIVFESRATSTKAFLSEVISFFGCRAMTGVMDVIIMAVSVDMLGGNNLLWKIISNGLSTVINYVMSKYVIFKKNNYK